MVENEPNKTETTRHFFVGGQSYADIAQYHGDVCYSLMFIGMDSGEA